MRTQYQPLDRFVHAVTRQESVRSIMLHQQTIFATHQTFSKITPFQRCLKREGLPVEQRLIFFRTVCATRPSSSAWLYTKSTLNTIPSMNCSKSSERRKQAPFMELVNYINYFISVQNIKINIDASNQLCITNDHVYRNCPECTYVHLRLGTKPALSHAAYSVRDQPQVLSYQHQFSSLQFNELMRLEVRSEMQDRK